MQSPAQVIDAARAALDLPSDYALARLFERPGSHFNDIRNGRRWFTGDDIPRLAEAIGIEQGELFLALEAGRTGDQGLIESAQRLLSKMGSRAAVVGGVCVAMSLIGGGIPAPVQAAARQCYILCQMTNARRLRRQFNDLARTAWATLFPAAEPFPAHA